MRIYLVRHGMAEHSAAGGTDRERALTEAGRIQLKQMTAVLAQAKWPIQRLACSPLLRARQTAELLAPAFGVDVEVEPFLGPGCRLDDIGEYMNRHQMPAHAMFVGHQPYLGHLVYVLTGASVAMRTGTIAVIEAGRIRPGMGTLCELYNPKVLARWGRFWEPRG